MRSQSIVVSALICLALTGCGSGKLGSDDKQDGADGADERTGGDSASDPEPGDSAGADSDPGYADSGDEDQGDADPGDGAVCYTSDGQAFDLSPIELGTVDYWRQYYALSTAGCPTSHLRLKVHVCGATFFVATDGDDDNAGTVSLPLTTLPAAIAKVSPGDCIYVRGGTYTIPATVTIRYKDGTPEAPVVLSSYNDEEVILECQTGTRSCMEVVGEYWHIIGITFQHSPQIGLYIYGGSHNIVERCTFRNNQWSGFSIRPRETAQSPTGVLNPSENKVINCDSYENFDPGTHGENADGFEVKNMNDHLPGPGNEFIGCRSWLNSDDGWDLWHSEERVTIDSCWAFSQGFNIWNHTGFVGNGGGFKFGQNVNTTGVAQSHLAKRCLAFGNGFHGFNENNSVAPITVVNCTSWLNAQVRTANNYSFPYQHQGETILNNVSFGGTVNIAYPSLVTMSNNSWQLADELQADDFVATLTLDQALAEAKAERGIDGALPPLSFMKPTSTSPLCGAATTAVPSPIDSGDGQLDIGAFECP